jgi:alkane 1-monooxygenase
MSAMRFFLPWLLPLLLMAAASVSGWLAWGAMATIQLLLALAERVPAWQHSPAARPSQPMHRLVLHGQVLLQFALLAWALACVQRQGMGAAETFALALAVGGTTGSQGITFAHELGHSRSRLDRALGWLLMASVCYAHFMVEHYRGHHPRAASDDDPASARRGESLWRFLPRTLAGSWASAWALERRQLAQLARPWRRSPLAWAVAAQVAWLVVLAAGLGWTALLFWLVQSAYAVWLLETVNYIEHYGLRRATVDGRREPFGVQHAWNADHRWTNSLLINLQRHSDHHLHAWKPFAALEPLPGPQLPTGYAGCLFIATVPRLWFGLMDHRLDDLAAIS